MSLAAKLQVQIAGGGPMTVAQYMTACLFDPQWGYYATHPRLGADGDFITAPLVSQMFGELIGLWAAETWNAMGRPPRVRLVEVGPGDGTLFSDLLRAARVLPAFLAAIDPWLVEVSEPLRAAQAARLSQAGVPPTWVKALAELPIDAPVLLIANEVLDCLPARQFVRTEKGWAERLVGLGDAGALQFGLAATAPPTTLPAAPGDVLEVSAAQGAFGAEIGQLLKSTGGVGLLVDYGRAEAGFGDTLQALRAHRKIDPLACPGDADLTVHADFPAVLAAAQAAGAAVSPILGQGEWLERLGITQRAAALARSRPDRADTLARQHHRLTAPEEMGELFKVAAIYAPADLAVPAF
jgi:NADH dehydrogenase [ubiquinone] 1 alpha subcomplex assembly factor 7